MSEYPEAWRWTCHACGWSLTNFNTKQRCDECGAHIRCEAAGGHHDFDKDHMCDYGCGYDFRTATTDLTQRRADY